MSSSIPNVKQRAKSSILGISKANTKDRRGLCVCVVVFLSVSSGTFIHSKKKKRRRFIHLKLFCQRHCCVFFVRGSSTTICAFARSAWQYTVSVVVSIR